MGGRRHFATGVGGMWIVPCSGGGGPSQGGRGSKHMAARGVPLPQSASLLSVVQSAPLLARLGLIVREAATARGLPHPGIARGGDGLEEWGRCGRCDVGGRGCPTPASGRWRAGFPAGRGHGGGRCTRLGLERRARDTWAGKQAPPPRPLSAAQFLPAFGSSRSVTPSCRGWLGLSRSRDGAKA